MSSVTDDAPTPAPPPLTDWTTHADQSNEIRQLRCANVQLAGQLANVSGTGCRELHHWNLEAELLRANGNAQIDRQAANRTVDDLHGLIWALLALLARQRQ